MNLSYYIVFEELPLKGGHTMCAANKHLSRHERHLIQIGLNENHSFKQIARDIGKDCTTISKEVRNNFIEVFSGGANRTFNPCIHRYDCDVTLICKNCTSPGKLCRRCKYYLCNKACKDFVEEKCIKLSKAPYVCNGCKKITKCVLKKKKYDYSKAHDAYEERLSETRSGVIITLREIDRLNDLLYPLVVEKRQSLHHVYIHHKDEIMFSEKTLYKLIDSGLLKVRNIDLELKVKRRPRKTETKVKIDKKCREGRTYDDFLHFMNENENNIAVVQMDTVEGEKGGKVLLTIHFCSCHLMLAFIRDYNDSQSVINIFDELYERFGHETFTKLFPVILTDNGSEFSNPTAIEFTKDGIGRTHIFYCDPAASHQKGECENNHLFIRKISPKGKSMDRFTQNTVDKMMSHINSYSRKSISDLSPIDLFITMYGSDILEKLNINRIHHDSINLSPSLLLESEKFKNK